MVMISRQAYAEMYGPTTGDRVRLGDTELWIRVEDDKTVYGDEVKFGGGKVIRDGMGQSQTTRAGGAVDTLITNALIVDYTGIYKADVGLKDGRIAAVGKAGNPDTQPGIDIIVGPGTEAIAGEGRILTAGGFDSHIHFICPQQIEDALHSGLTTMLGGGTGPAHGINTPPWQSINMKEHSLCCHNYLSLNCSRHETPVTIPPLLKSATIGSHNVITGRVAGGILRR